MTLSPQNPWFSGKLAIFERYKVTILLEMNLTAKAPENGWLEYDRFLLGPGLFRGAFVVIFTECILPNTLHLGCKSPYENHVLTHQDDESSITLGIQDVY